MDLADEDVITQGKGTNLRKCWNWILDAQKMHRIGRDGGLVLLI